MAILELKDGLTDVSLVVSDVDSVKAFNLSFLHLRRNYVAAIAGQTIYAGSDQEVRLRVSGRAEKFINIALAITNMNASRRFTQQRG